METWRKLYPLRILHAPGAISVHGGFSSGKPRTWILRYGTEDSTDWAIVAGSTGDREVQREEYLSNDSQPDQSLLVFMQILVYEVHHIIHYNTRRILRHMTTDCRKSYTNSQCISCGYSRLHREVCFAVGIVFLALYLYTLKIITSFITIKNKRDYSVKFDPL